MLTRLLLFTSILVFSSCESLRKRRQLSPFGAGGPGAARRGPNGYPMNPFFYDQMEGDFMMGPYGGGCAMTARTPQERWYLAANESPEQVGFPVWCYCVPSAFECEATIMGPVRSAECRPPPPPPRGTGRAGRTGPPPPATGPGPVCCCGSKKKK